MRTLKIVLASLIVGAAVGFIPLYMQLREVRAQLETTEERLNAELAVAREDLILSDTHSRLGLLITRVRQSDFEKARGTSTQLYDQAEQALLIVEDADTQRRLRTLTDTRDDVTAALALNDPRALDTLERLFVLLGDSL